VSPRPLFFRMAHVMILGRVGSPKLVRLLRSSGPGLSGAFFVAGRWAVCGGEKPHYTACKVPIVPTNSPSVR
jgi:hypothetical protein